MTEKPDPFNVEALEKSLNDSATRVSAIWVSFLVFGLYLVIAAGTVTHRQLLLEDPVKLPILNVELPLVGFFFLAPALFVVFHTYVLLQVLLLGRTAAAYNEALDRAVKPPPGNASMRQRLANTLFAQIFAGSPRERSGWLGALLQMMAWLTLVVAPILVLLAVQFQFLPYHSGPVTWTHRILIALDLVAVLVLWPALRYADRDVSLRLIVRRWFPLSFATVVVASAWIVLTFPGEPHAKWTRYWPGEKHTTAEVECRTVSPVSAVFSSFDRLYLPRVDVVDREKLKNIERNTKEAGDPDYQGERTRILRERDLNCGDFSGYADLRRVDLTGTSLRGAFLRFAHLQGASLKGAQLQYATLEQAQLQGASLDGAHLRGALLLLAQLQGASLEGAQLQGASLEGAQLQGAFLRGAGLEGASLDEAQLQGAFLRGAGLEGASLFAAQLQGAFLNAAHLQGAVLNGAQLQGASLAEAGLQGVDLYDSSLMHTILENASVWRARNATCEDARVTGVITSAPPPERIANIIDQAVKDIPSERRSRFFPSKQDVIDRMRAGLIVDPAEDDTAAIEEVWRKCEQISNQVSQAEFQQKYTAFLRDLTCGGQKAAAEGIIRGFDYKVENGILDKSARAQFARGLLGEDGKPCAATKDLDEATKARLRALLPASEPASAVAGK
jgi:uncharacterized protein YjbI with pentapeptide repeats